MEEEEDAGFESSDRFDKMGDPDIDCLARFDKIGRRPALSRSKGHFPLIASIR